MWHFLTFDDDAASGGSTGTNQPSPQRQARSGSRSGADPNVHLFASNDGGHSFSEVFTRPSRQPAAYVLLLVQFKFPNGDFPIQINTYGTIVARIVSNG